MLEKGMSTIVVIVGVANLDLGRSGGGELDP
jgi:hypothetical protein